MTINTAKDLLTSIECNLDGRMRYTYESTDPDSFKVKMEDVVSSRVRYLSFDLKKAKNRSVDVEFRCHGFSFNFPLKKNVDQFTFKLYDFEKLITYGIKVDENCLDPGSDLDVEF